MANSHPPLTHKMTKDKTWRPAIVDKTGRGELCSRIDQITKAIGKAKERNDKDEMARLLARLDRERAAFHKLYRHTPKPVEVAHAELTERD